MQRSNLRIFFLLAIGITWLAALVAAATLLDERVARWVHDTAPLDREARLTRVLSWPGVFGFTAAMGAIVVLVRMRWQDGAFVLLAGVFSGANWMVKWILGRSRPYRSAEEGLHPFDVHPFKNGVKGLFTQTNLAFPSGHTTLAFATAVALCLLFPRWRPVFLLLAVVVAAQRMLVNAHYVSDTVAGAAMGTLAALAAWRVYQTYLLPRQHLPVEPVTQEKERSAA